MSSWDDIAKKYKAPTTTKPATIPVVSAKPNQTISGVVSAKPQQKITGVVSAQPNATIKPAGFIGPIAPINKPAQVPPSSAIKFAPLLPLSANSNSTISSVGNTALEQQNANPVKNFFTELPSATSQVTKDIVRTPVRAALSVMASAAQQQDPIVPETPAQKFMIGDQPVVPIARQASDNELALKDKGFGKLSTPLGISGAVLSGTLDLYPGLGDADAKAAKEATSILTDQLAKGVAKDEILNTIYSKFGVKVGKLIEEKTLPKVEQQLAKQGADAALKPVLEVPKPKTLITPPKITSVTQPERGFISTVKESPTILSQTKQTVADKVASNYTPITNEATLKEAQDLVAKDANEALKFAKQTKPTAKSFATAQVLINKFAQEGNFEAAIDLVEVTAKKATESGQAIQALSMYDRLTPEGVLQYAQRQFDQANEFIPKETNKLKLDPELAGRLRQQALDLQRLPDGSRDKIVKTAEMLKNISDQIPSSLGKKISLVQTMGQLLNPKTLIRNIVGNTGFAVAENVKDVIATPIDWAVSKFTGERTKALPSLTVQAKGFKRGLSQGFEDAWKGIDTSAAGSQFDLPKGQVFKVSEHQTPKNVFGWAWNGVKDTSNKVFGGLEKTMNIVLRSPDRAAYQAAFDNSLSQQLKLSGISDVAKATPEMLHTAHLDGLYRTFQDESVPAKIFSGIKKALNGYKDFGIGDAILKYPKTPGNLLARGIDYSPAGFLKSVVELGKPLFGRSFDQKAFIESASRALTGTAGLVGTGAILHKLGIITGRSNSDSDINALQKATGLGQYKINVSGLMRFITSGFDAKEAKLKEGDRTLSYDWFQPAAIGLSIGANIDENRGSAKGAAGTLISSLGQGVDTLAEQPLVSGLTNLFKYKNPSDAAAQVLQSVPNSFIPTLLSQIRQVTDKNQRNTQDANWVQETMKLAENKIPGLSKLLPKKYGTFGEELTNNQGPIATFVSPAILDQYITTPEQQMVLDIYNNSGLKTQAPRLVPAKQTVNGKSIELSGAQQSEMQRVVGQLTQERFTEVSKDPKFLRLSDEDKAKTLASVMSDINTAAKYELLGHRPKSLSTRAKKYIKILRQNP